jgi:TRAP-type C4-dicarboxylate transport system substrate-binding protein
MRSKTFRCLIATAVIGGYATFFGAAPAAAAEPVVLKISHQFPANTDFRDQVARKFAAEVEKRTDGAIKFQIYPGSSLFKAKQQFDAMANGSLDMSVYPLAYSGGKMPAVNITLMPALIKNYKQAYNWEDAPIGKWLSKYLADHGVVLVSWIWQAGGVASRDKPILVPNDVKGLKVRGAGKMIDLMLQSAGGAIASFPSSESYNAMQSGVVDAIWTSSASLMSFRMNEVAKFVTTAQDHTFWYMFEPLLMSKATYDKLTPKQQKIVMDVGRSLQAFSLESCKKDDAKVAKMYGDAGDKVSTMNAAQFDKWKAIAQKSAYKNFAGHVKNGKKLIEMAEAVATQ